MKLGGSLGNVPQKLKKKLIYFLLLVHFQKYNLISINWKLLVLKVD
jgi:hypothetical protein